MELTPIPDSAVDPRLKKHLAGNEDVLWQGAPAPGSLVSRFSGLGALATAIAGALCVANYPPEFFDWLWRTVDSLPTTTSLAPGSENSARIIIGLFLLVISLPTFLVNRYRREKHWVYGITTSRLLMVNHGRLRHQAARGKVGMVGIRRRFLRGALVHWTGGNDDGALGFAGQKDPERLRTLIQRWLEMDDEAVADGTATGESVTRSQDSAGVFIERSPALWLVVVSLVALFGYWAYVNLWSGTTVSSHDFVRLAEGVPPPDELKVLGANPYTFIAAPILLAPEHSPVRLVLKVEVRSRAANPEYHVVLVDERGTAVWQESGRANAGTVGRPAHASGDIYVRSHPTGSLTIERAAEYALYGRFATGSDHRVEVRAGVLEADRRINLALLAVLVVAGGVVVREELRRRAGK